jgi:hypothetical protein
MVRAGAGDVAQLGEHLLCKQGVVGSIPIVSTRGCPHQGVFLVFLVSWRGYRFGVLVCAWAWPGANRRAVSGLDVVSLETIFPDPCCSFSV